MLLYLVLIDTKKYKTSEIYREIYIYKSWSEKKTINPLIVKLSKFNIGLTAKNSSCCINFYYAITQY